MVELPPLEIHDDSIHKYNSPATLIFSLASSATPELRHNPGTVALKTSAIAEGLGGPEDLKPTGPIGEWRQNVGEKY